MPDIHHNVAGQLQEMRRREMHDCSQCGALRPVRSLLESLREQRITNASRLGGEGGPAKVDTAPISTVLLPVTQVEMPTPASASKSEPALSATEPVLEPDEVREPTLQNTTLLRINNEREISVAAEHGLPTRPKVERIVDVEEHIVLHNPSIAVPPAGLRVREFTVHQVVGSEVYMNQRRYLVRWGDSVVAQDYIIFRNDKCFILIDGHEWEAASCSILRYDERGIALYDVQWEDSFLPECELENAREAIGEFERNENEATAAHEMGPDVRDSIERTAFVDEHPPSPATPGGRHASSETDGAYDSQPAIFKLIFSPEARADYAPGVRELIERTMGADCPVLKKWPAEYDKRPLLYAAEYIAKASVFDMTRPEKLNAAFAQIAGERQWRPCECCQKGNGPFLGCVVATNFAKGACANCACSWHSRKCNFHVKSTVERWMPTVELSPSPSRSASPQHHPSPELGTVFTPPTTQSSTSPRCDTSYESESSRHTSPDRTPASSPNSRSSESKLADIAGSGLPRRSKRLASSVFPSGSEDDDALAIGEVGSYTTKIPRLSREVSLSDEDTWVKIESTTYSVNWRPTSFRHPGCGGHENRPCQNRSLVPHIDSLFGTLRLRGRVMSDRVFVSGEANEDEVRYILSCSPCYFIESIHTAWQTHKDDADAAWTRESFASQHFTNELNEAVRRFCPHRQLPQHDQTIIELD